MSNVTPSPTPEVPAILHEDDVRAVIRDEISTNVPAATAPVPPAAAIPDPAAAPAAYDPAEQGDLVTTVTAILAALRTHGIVAP
jgi:hypothetical protein